MTEAVDILPLLHAANAASPFHGVTGFRIEAAGEGAAALRFDAQPNLLNHAGALHAGVQCAALDSVSGYAAATLAGAVVTLSMTTQFLSSAKGDAFRAEGKVTRQGRNQLFVEARLFAERREEAERLVASAVAVLTKPA